AAERKDRLVAPVASLLRGAAGGVTLDDEKLGQRRVALLAVGQLSGEPAPIERTLPARELLGLAGCLADARRFDALQDDATCLGRVLLEVEGEPVVHERLDRPFDLAVPELRLRLALELGLRDLDADDGRQALAHV